MSTNRKSVKSVARADVYKGGHFAATLSRSAMGVVFAYQPDYLSSASQPVCVSLPLRAESYLTAGGAVPPFFAGLLPEGRRLTALRQRIKTSADDELSLLLAVGTDPIGDVVVVPAGSHPKPAEPLMNIAGSFDTIRFVDVLNQQGIIDPVAIPGVQDKASLKGLSLPIGQASDRFILKMDPPEHPNIVANEAYFLALSTQAGIPTADFTNVTDADGRPGLLVRRFDRVATEDGPTSLECEDACQLMGRWPADKYNLTSEAVARSITARCAAPIVAARDVLRQLVFAWLTGNGDVHAKNLSVLRDRDGERHLSPAYDLPSTVPYGDTTMALSIGGRTQGISRRRWIEFGQSIGVREAATTKTIDGLLDATADLTKALSEGALPFDQTITHKLVAELRNRRQLLTNR